MARVHDDALIVRSVVDLARNLGLRTVAEGVDLLPGDSHRSLSAGGGQATVLHR